jgi:NADPH-dependent ferric siderophore reductase
VTTGTGTAPLLHDVEVARVRRLTPRLVRITLAGPTLARFADAGPDQRFKLFLPRGDQDRPTLPDGDDWFARWRAMPDEVRPIMRTYTIRRLDPAAATIDVDFVLHDEAPGRPVGPAAAWASRARPGDRVGVSASRAEFRLDPAAGWHLLVGDETALPAIAAILARLPTGTSVHAYVEVADAGEELPLETAADATIRWVHRGTAVPAGTGTALATALGAAALPAGTPQAWIAGERDLVKGVRRHLIGRGIPATAITFGGYWRVGAPVDPD